MRWIIFIVFGSIGAFHIARGVYALEHGVTSFGTRGRGPATPYGAIVLGALFLSFALIAAVFGDDKKPDPDKPREDSH
jgi:hypothetical protein